MSAEKTGALIVLERTTQLDEVRHSGVIINADVSDSLIRNLFYNRAPLHDGALVIDSNKIVAAACILPLPKHTAVDNELGTRHRAAVGMSEVSDAIIIVVSEETGTISVAKESELKRGFTEDSLRKFLVKELVRDKQVQENN
jgi:diadenylate cyclase